MAADKGSPYYEALPPNLKPFHYDIYVHQIDTVNDIFSGRVTIKLDVVSETNEIHLHHRDLSIPEGSVRCFEENEDQSTEVPVKGMEVNAKRELLIVQLAKKVAKGGRLKVEVTYGGIIQDNMAGFYKSHYNSGEETKCMLSTQFEATDARRAFPCLDEPALKATFDVTVEVPADWVALGNMPILHEKPIGSGLKSVSFETTPVMSTYLVAWACGEFEYIESETNDKYCDGKPLTVRIYTTKGYVKDAELASEIAPKIVDYFSKTFEIQYPLPKLDLIAVHAFSHNAMENWGLITYRSTALLYSETKSDPAYKRKVAYVVAHEIAHQWFGNLVTMKWWDELWLNEGFATWVGFTAVDYLFPEWDIFGSFVSDSLQQALNLDGLRNSHPIEVPVVDALDIDQVFDAISYLKGASTILMLSNYLGTDIFLKGVARYLQRNKFSNAASADLWNAIGEVSGKPVSFIMDSWIKRIGFPVIKVDADPSNETLKLTQSRFLNEGKVFEEENTTKWWVPLNISTGPGSKDVLHLNYEGTEDATGVKTIQKFPYINKFFKLNKDSRGVYRVDYSKDIMETNILPYITKLSSTDKVGLLADVASISISGTGHSTTSTFLQIVDKLAKSGALGDNYIVWLELGKRLDQLLITFSEENSKLSDGLQSFARSIYKDAAVKYINSPSEELDFLQLQLRANILLRAGLLKIPEAKSYALQLFEKWKKGDQIHPSLKQFVFTTIVSSADIIDEEKFNLILGEAINSPSLDSREISLSSLGHIDNAELSEKLISYLIRPDIVPTMDSHFLGQSLTENPKTRKDFWSFFKANYNTFYKLMSMNMVVLDRFIKLSLGNYQDLENYNDIKEFFSTKDIHGFERSYHQVLDNIKINSSWYVRDKDEVSQWLANEGYI
ncbi:Piso0_002991 [Millerozyma farinosa CBS 7064]|uniref:Aminopeptidase n=1 Tax=Pichia sorbitophila (strain ATCC MYA-4447 / BCRC 22081 / CBS 7064 / NBRC 10061 / NRRL Y-12695) TaxID=559304 RepID=G8YGW2_PICSO|nr:Piso0_002991 [Millerozyma farinosa CBS 7064]CCE80664.1 Piso0_002991 [Millerozyma farinosa CBS 7064]